MREALSGGGMSVTEAAGADQPIARLPTSTTGFVGRALRGPVNRASRACAVSPSTSRSSAASGSPACSPYAVEQYFDNGGREAVVVRVINGGAPATITLPCGKESLHARGGQPGFARDAARIGRLRQHRQQRRRPLQPGRAACSNARFGAHRRPGNLPPSFDANRARRASSLRALQESMLVRVRGVVPHVRPDRTFRAGARHPIGYVDSNPDGDDGAPLTDYDLIGSAGPRHRTVRAARRRGPAFPLHSAARARSRRRAEPAARGGAVLSRASRAAASSIRPQRGKPATKHCEGCAGSRSKVNMP